MALFAKLKELDAYTKPMEDFRVKTLTGGFVTVTAMIAIILLSISETTRFFIPDTVEQLYVDSTSSDVRVDVHFDVIFHKLPCPFVTIDVMDVSSETQDNVEDDIYKLRIDKDGHNVTDTQVQKMDINLDKQNKTTDLPPSASTTPKCGSCYGALPAPHCCNTCDEVKEAYSIKGWQVNADEVEQCKSDRWVAKYLEYKGEGCRVYGKVQVAKVAGNFHFAPGDPYRSMRSHVHDLHSLDSSRFDTAHTFNRLSFGSDYPGKTYPVDGKTFNANRGGVMYQYYVKVVPTSYNYLDGRVENSHQFSITTHMRNLTQATAGLPGLFVQYEFSPLMVRYEERKQPLTSFLVSLCAIIGGIFTVAQLIDTAIYQSARVIQRKMAINKLG